MYADMDVRVDDAGGWVEYSCPICGKPIRMPMEGFLYVHDRWESRCTSCWGDPRERGGE